MPDHLEIPLLTRSTAGATITISATARVLLAVFSILLLHLTISPPSKSTYHTLFLSFSDNATAARHLLALTRRPHVAGTPANVAAAAYVLAVLSSFSLPARSVYYDVYINYPRHRSLILSPSPPPSQCPTLAFDLVQEIYPGDPYADAAAEVLPHLPRLRPLRRGRRSGSLRQLRPPGGLRCPEGRGCERHRGSGPGEVWSDISWGHYKKRGGRRGGGGSGVHGRQGLRWRRAGAVSGGSGDAGERCASGEHVPGTWRPDDARVGERQGVREVESGGGGGERAGAGDSIAAGVGSGRGGDP